MTHRHSIALAAITTTFTLMLSSCNSDPEVDARVFVELKGLSPLEPDDRQADDTAGHEYVLWKNDGTTSQPIERFTSATGIVTLSFPAADSDSIRSLFVTIERVDDIIDTPSRSVLLAGELIEGQGTMQVAHVDAIGTGFEDANGSYRLTTPSTAMEADYDQGIWWFDFIGTPVQSLFLPTLPQGWTYEGWILGGSSPRSTGKFRDAGRFDSDGGGSLAADGTDPPLFPGQDYISDPVALGGLTAAISVEPVPDFSAGPFGLRVLLDQVIDEVRVNQPMENVTTGRLPTGSVTTNRR